jgi:hypothetical protein
MAKASENADDIATTIFRAVQRGDFLILPTAGDRSRWRIKRFFPEMFFRKLVAAVRGRG